MNPPPAVVEDAMRAIFMRLPPDDPESLASAAAVCTSWRGILFDPGFALLDRRFWGAPPMLGFLYEELDIPGNQYDEVYWVSHFVSTGTFRTPACLDRPYWHVLDSRHGRVLFYTPRMEAEFVVCDLVSGYQWEIHADRKFDDIMWWEWEEEDKQLERIRCNAAVLCANDRCEHLDCHGGPFRIALVDSIEGVLKGRATFYSSETGEWSNMVEVYTPDFIWGTTRHNAVVGNKVYVPCVESDSLVEYNMDDKKLTVINPPYIDHPDEIYPIGVEGGMPLFASVMNHILYLWSMEVGPSGDAGWARHRTIDLAPSLPPDVLPDWRGLEAVGFAEGTRVSVILLSTYNGLYTVDLKSGKGKKAHEQERQIEKAMPYMSF
ncbi:unnamed protein product [Alopecurus aequalis]